jgi:hypothetical protein
MIKENISFGDLSLEIKKEIEQFYSDNSFDTLESAMEAWFTDNFEQWLQKRIDSKTNRKYMRLEVELPVSVIDTVLESSEDDVEAKDFVGKIVNISRGGLYFRSTGRIEISSIIKVKVDFSSLDDGIQPIEALAMVVRVDAMVDGKFGIGVMFSTIYEEEQKCLDLFIFKNLAFSLYGE